MRALEEVGVPQKLVDPGIISMWEVTGENAFQGMLSTATKTVTVTMDLEIKPANNI